MRRIFQWMPPRALTRRRARRYNGAQKQKRSKKRSNQLFRDGAA
jgi:hypothetical protein